MHDAVIREKLAEAGLRATYPRLALIAELSRSESQPKSAAELSATLSQFPRSSIYRNLEVLEKANLIKSNLVKWVRRFELGDALTPHHHHITCTICHKMVDFDSSKLEKQLANIASDAKFKLDSHTVELRGICSDCSTEPEPVSALTALSDRVKSIKRLRPTDPIMDKLVEEDIYHGFDPDTDPHHHLK